MPILKQCSRSAERRVILHFTLLHNSTCPPRGGTGKNKTNAHEQIGIEGFFCLTHAMHYPHGWAELSSNPWPILPSTAYGFKQYLAQRNKPSRVPWLEPLPSKSNWENRRTAFSTQACYMPPQSSSFYRKTLNHMKFYFIIMVQMQPSNFHS